MTSEADRRALLRMAREAIVAHVTGTAAPEAEPSVAAARVAGVFVTLHAHGELRGCIGHMAADTALSKAVPECAVAACSRDPRFPAVTPAEVPHLEIELSILGPLEPALSADAIEVGRHGVAVERGWQRGLLLPQVATEWNWNARMFVEQACRKAGLPLDAWERGATLWKFEAEVFGEEPLRRAGRGGI
jgi:AmmeMemoRadiSam system protein A